MTQPPPPPTPDFVINLSVPTVAIALGSSNQIQVTDRAVNGFSGPVTISISALPVGVTVSPSLPQLLTPGGLTLTFTATTSALVGTYTPLISGSSGGLQHSANLQLSLDNRAQLNLGVPAHTVSLLQASSTSMDLSVDAGPGIVDFSAQLQAIVPTGVTASFSSPTVSPDSTVTLTLAVSPTALIGPAVVTIEATRNVDGVEFSTNLPIVIDPDPVITGNIIEFPVLTAAAAPSAITRGPDLAMWFGEEAANQLGRIALDGTVSEYPVPTQNAGIGGIVTGSDGNLYFTESKVSQIATYNFGTGQITEGPIPVQAAGP